MDHTAQREQMVIEQLEGRNITNPRVLAAMRKVPRHVFVPPDLQHLAYRDGPLPIGRDQTISQPYIVALMTQYLMLSGHEVVLEVGTGSGYQTAILCELASQVYSLERDPVLANQAATRLTGLGYRNVEVLVGDGSQGLADMSPFDAILVSAAAPAIPGPLRSPACRRRAHDPAGRQPRTPGFGTCLAHGRNLAHRAHRAGDVRAALRTLRLPRADTALSRLHQPLQEGTDKIKGHPKSRP